jgi:hypothetical protein
MNDKLDNLYSIQEKFTELFLSSKNVTVYDVCHNRDLLIKYNKEYILATIKETTDILDKLDWKMHIRSNEKDIKDNILEECIDAIKYIFGLMIINGFSVDSFYEKFVDKSKVVEAKFEQERLLEKIYNDREKKIAFIDIDGILCQWPKPFIDFANYKMNESFCSIKDIIKKYDQLVFNNLKLEYRLSGIKRTIPIIDGAVDFVNKLKENDYFVVLLTARPYKTVFRIYSDTLYWLESNNIKYDAIIWDENKETFILKYFMNNNIKFVVDDDFKNAKKLSENKIKVYLKTDDKIIEENITTFSSFSEIEI